MKALNTSAIIGEESQKVPIINIRGKQKCTLRDGILLAFALKICYLSLTLKERDTSMRKKPNPVARNLNRNRPQVIKLKTLYNRKQKDWKND